MMSSSEKAPDFGDLLAAFNIPESDVGELTASSKKNVTSFNTDPPNITVPDASRGMVNI